MRERTRKKDTGVTDEKKGEKRRKKKIKRPKKNGKKPKRNEKKTKQKGKAGPKKSHQSRVFFWFQTSMLCVIGFIKYTNEKKKKK